ncbi:hypothetical protein [Hymenobacter bucti]|uniref:Uncharacterized protein n=1 Tax=Hymenobacter bucti TaxID=1844114 RepID=A0ABW4QXJ9_9BACT
MPTPFLLEELFFPVKSRPLQTSIDDEIQKVPRYRVLTCEQGVLGVKPAWQAEAQPRPSPLGRHLVVDHAQAHALSQALYQQTFGEVGGPHYWVGAAPVGELRPVGAWATVVYGQESATLADVLPFSLFDERTRANRPVAPWEWALQGGQDAPFRQELARFEPALAFTNGFDYDDELTFYVLVTMPEMVAPKHVLAWLDETERRRPRRPVLVLKTGKFKASYIEQLYKLTGTALLEKAKLALPEIALSFRQELLNFANLYYALQHTPVVPDHLMPVTLDLYDLNRNIRTVQGDANLQSRIRRRAQDARAFFTAHQDGDLAALVRYLMYQDAFDPTRFDRRAAEEALSRRDAYRNLQTRLNLRTLNNPPQLYSYLESQHRDWESLAPELY